MARFRGLEHGVQGPGLGFGRAARGIHGDDVDAGMLLDQIDARARPLDLAADRRRHRDPMAVGARKIVDRRVHRAVLLDQLRHDVVDRLEALGVRLRLPGREGENVVSRARLRLGRDRQQVLVALRGDVVDRDLDLLLRGPLVDQRRRRVVGAGNPVVPKAHRQFAGSVRAAHMGHGNNRRRGGGGRQKTASRHLALGHDASPPWVSRADAAVSVAPSIAVDDPFGFASVAASA